MAACDATSAAKRRRERRLRAWLRHERQSIAMHLAEALHHSAGSSWTKVVERREGEGVEGEQYVGLRAQKPPPPGTRPAAPKEPVPQGFWPGAPRQPGHEVPSVVPAGLGGGDDGVDAAALAFLLQQNLLRQEAERREEEERLAQEEMDLKRKEEDTALEMEAAFPDQWVRDSDAAGRRYFFHLHSHRTLWTLPAGASLWAFQRGSSSGGTGRRKKKKRRKRMRRVCC